MMFHNAMVTYLSTIHWEFMDQRCRAMWEGQKKQNKGWLNYQLHNNITNDEDPTGIQYLMLQRCDSFERMLLFYEL
eukprot:scaffold44637_cov74-Cyclotella_meneghiniana.AAC.7